MSRSEHDDGFKRLYQAWASLPTFLSEFGEWIHGEHCPIGNPRTNAKKCREDLETWRAKHADAIATLEKKVAESKRVGSDIRVNTHVYQIWPMTERSPWRTGMFDEVTEDPFGE